MTTLGGRPIFLDTNILVYASIDKAPLHLLALNTILVWEDTGNELWISRQILREYLAVLSRPQTFTPPVSIATLIGQVQAFETRFQIAEDDAQVTSKLLSLIHQVSIGGKQIHDANIVATMQVHGITHLLTHNTADFARFAHLITILTLQPGTP